jgi:hypothetical protein
MWSSFLLFASFDPCLAVSMRVHGGLEDSIREQRTSSVSCPGARQLMMQLLRICLMPMGDDWHR